MNEIWRDIKDYEGLYQVSNLGKIKSLKRQGTNGGILKAVKTKNGYLHIELSKNKKLRTFSVHRLVTEAFIENTENKPQVNHKDGDKTNNCVSNLEWCTAQYNIDYSNSKRVNQYDKQGNFIKTWKSMKEAERELNICNSNISRCCNGKAKTTGGYIWRYDDENMWQNK